MKKWILVTVAVLSVICSAEVFAQKLTPRPPIYGIPAKTLPQGKWIFRGYWILPQYDKMYSAADKKMVDIPDNMEFQTSTAILKVRYGINSRLTAIMNFPYAHKKLETSAATKNGDGLGDVIGALLYKAYHQRQRHFLFSFLLFTKFPTGKASDLAATELPLGSGSFDIGAAFLPEKEFGKWDMRWSAFYIRRGKNKDDVNLGDVASFSWSTAYNFSRKFIAEGTLLYKSTAENSYHGSTINDSDNYLVQIIPGIQYRIQRTFLTQFVLPVTLKSKLPFSSSVETWVGLFYLF